MRIVLSLVLIISTSIVFIHHLGMIRPNIVSESDLKGPPGKLIEMTSIEHRHVLLEGGPSHIGSEAGRLLKKQLKIQEDALTSKLKLFIPSKFIQNTFFTIARLWFLGADTYIDTSSLKEMEGVGENAPYDYDYLGDGYLRQLAYHGLHEVGQMFVDEDRADMACFAVITKDKDKNTIIGRNFDFDVDGIFDREKLLKWVWPDQGVPYLSVVWAGMVGVVTGVNESGIYASINAAGTEDFARIGTPTTIVVKQVLQNSRSLDEAIKIVEDSKTFITDIFLLADTKSGKVVIIEKSPARFITREIISDEVITNHLTDSSWNDDSVNTKRRDELTSSSRKQRGLEILQNSIEKNLITTLSILRDRKLPNNKPSHLAHRGSIDAFIASHSVLMDFKTNTFYVGLGPGVIGEYIGYDLSRSFLEKKPIVVARLPADRDVSREDYAKWTKWITRLSDFSKSMDCDYLKYSLQDIEDPLFIHYDKERFLGDYSQKCLNDMTLAKEHWKKSLSFTPAYKKQRDLLLEKIK